MKKTLKIILFVLLAAFLATNISCRHSCKTMKYHNKDVKKGLAH